MSSPLTRERALIRARLIAGPEVLLVHYPRQFGITAEEYIIYTRDARGYLKRVAGGGSWDAALADLEAQYPDGRQS